MLVIFLTVLSVFFFGFERPAIERILSCWMRRRGTTDAVCSARSGADGGGGTSLEKYVDVRIVLSGGQTGVERE